MFVPSIAIGASLSNDEWRKEFQCSPQGGMRRAHKTNTLVLVSDHYGSIYDDRWVDSVLHYTGMGQKGDQQLKGNQNLTLYESRTNGVGVFLFEVFTPKPKEYVFRGRVELVDDPYQEDQPDSSGDLRKVWVFPIQLAGGKQTPAVSEDELRSGVEQRTRHAERLPDQAVQRRAEQAATRSGSRQVITTQRTRDPYVIEHTKRRAKGICQLCGNTAPFNNKKDEPFLEVHHIEWLARDGDDSISNTVALCPNCHRKMHILDRAEDKRFLQSQIS
jgi:5-methylcytosine-specific restriction protein A